MEPIESVTGRAIALCRDDVDTDQIVPAEYCKRLTKSGYADALFAHWRRDPDFVLNRPDHAGASVLVGGHNFGTGSSREHAVWALRDWGFRAVVATGFGDIFRRNAWKNGLLAVALPADVLGALSTAALADPAFEITVDLRRQCVLAAGSSWQFEVDPRARWLLLDGLDDIDVTIAKTPAIVAYERGRASWLPAIGPDAPHTNEQPVG
jgi:3-isopropylmalate/(R)-2-methylmalate dehydratase small subunit